MSLRYLLSALAASTACGCVQSVTDGIVTEEVERLMLEVGPRPVAVIEDPIIAEEFV